MRDMPRAALLTGERGVGKTTLCMKLAEVSRRYAGLLSPPIINGQGGIVGFQARCVEEGGAWELARSDLVLEGPRLGRFWFSEEGVRRAVACLQTAFGAAGRIVIVDEIGPLELESGLGFSPVLPLFASAGNLLIVVRRELVPAVDALVPRHQREVFTLVPGNGEELSMRIREFLEAGG
jgi:nucleoside-triphosphatase